MSRIILLDSGPLGYALTPAVNATHLRCSQWLEALILKQEQIALAEIVDYECRRGWIRHDNTAALASLDRAKATLLPAHACHGRPNIVSHRFPIRLKRQVVRSGRRVSWPLAEPELGESPAQIKNAGGTGQERGPRAQKIEEIIHRSPMIPPPAPRRQGAAERLPVQELAVGTK